MTKPVLSLLIALTLLQSYPAQGFMFSFGGGGAVTGDQTRYATELIKRFKSAHPEVDLELKDSTKSYVKPLIDTLMNENTPNTADLAIIGVAEWPVLLKKNMLSPLSKVFAPNELTRIRKSVRSELDVQAYGGNFDARAYSLPFNRSHALLFVNTALLDLKTGDFTWSELEKALSDARQARPQEAQKLKLSLSTGEWIAETLFANARGDSSIVGRQGYFDDPGIRELITTLRRMREHEQIELVKEQHNSYLDFTDGKVAATVLSFSSYNSIVLRSPVPVRVTFPPRLLRRTVTLGGGDLVLLNNPARPLSEKAIRDIHKFIDWFYLGPGASLWSDLVGYPPLTRSALASPTYKERLQRRPQDRDIYSNPRHWQLKSMFRLDETCYTLKARRVAGRAFETALSTQDLQASLLEANKAATKIFEQPCI